MMIYANCKYSDGRSCKEQKHQDHCQIEERGELALGNRKLMKAETTVLIRQRTVEIWPSSN